MDPYDARRADWPLYIRRHARWTVTAMSLFGIACSSGGPPQRTEAKSNTPIVTDHWGSGIHRGRHEHCRLRRGCTFGDWQTPANVGEPVNSVKNEFHPSISADGLSLYISSTRAGSTPPNASCFSSETTGACDGDIWVAQRARLDSPWGEPVNLGPNVNTDYSDFGPELSPDGRRLYFSSGRPGGVGSDDIWFSRRRDRHDDLAWEPAENLGPDINTEFDENRPSVFHDKETGVTSIYFNSLLRPNGIGDYDIYVSTQREDDTFGPGVLVPELSSPKRDTPLAIRRDGLEIILTSNRKGTLGKLDLWVATRASTSDPWSTPTNLGETLNSTSNDGGPALSCDGTAMYFYSDRPGGVGPDGTRDLYVATRTATCDDDDDDDDER